MKQPRIILCCVLLMLAGMYVNADTSFTSTGWLSAVPLPGISTTNSSGQVSLKGNVHVVRILSNESHVTGRLQAWMDLAYQSDGTATFSGPAYSEVGTWDATGTNFTPYMGVWVLNYSGVVKADGSSQYSMAGYGIGGTIEGARISLTATRANQDPATPYLASGTIKPAPVQSRLVVDNFDDNHLDASLWSGNGAGSGILSLVETNQQLTLGGTWRSPTYLIMNCTAWVTANRGGIAQEGQTLESRVDLVSLNSASAGVNLALYNGGSQGYGLTKASDYIALWKQNGSTATFFCAKRVQTSNTNVVLVFGITPVGQNVILTGKVLDKSGTVLAQQSYVDTPAADAALSSIGLTNFTGGRVWHDVGADLAGAPWKSASSVALMVAQDTDGTLPTALATFDNVELRNYDVPQVGIERAVRLSWPNTGQNYVIESAPTVNGPWQPVANPELPGMQSLTLPAVNLKEFIRVQ